jgi:hypothetical protein
MCRHIDWPCCGCGDNMEHDDDDLCPWCGKPEAHCRCEEYDDDCDPGDMDGDHETALASAGWGMDEDYRCEDDYYADDYDV